MKFIVSSVLLEKRLSVLSGVIPSNPVLPILDHFHFEIKGGKMIIRAFDMQISMTTELSVESADEGRLCVPARQFLDTIKSLPEQPITILMDEEKMSLEIISYNGRYKLTGEDATDFPAAPQPDGLSKVTMPADQLTEAIASTLFAVGSDELRPAMTGLFWELGKNTAEYVATDGNRLVKYRRTDVQSETAEPVIIPRKALTLLKASLPGDNRELVMQRSEGQVFFDYDNIRLSCRLIDERFPDYQNAIPTDNANILEVERTELLNSLKRLAIYTSRTTSQIRLKLSPDRFQIFAEDIDFSNEAHETLAAQYEGEELEIGFNVKFLIEMLNNLNSKEVRFSFSTPNRAGILTPIEQSENEEILMLIMPVMLSTYA
ncbi:MAG: DNA polymerase III subunit beta [Microscillaceae bacterium]|nr:DNA polymerase III subunit beta [Microscillaceae bacterium]